MTKRLSDNRFWRGRRFEQVSVTSLTQHMDIFQVNTNLSETI